jgi:exodeoxyribonuclease III
LFHLSVTVAYMGVINIFFSQAKTQLAGFTVEERESFERNFSSKGLIDTFRKQHSNAVAYTFWGENQRITNIGMSLNHYFVIGELLSLIYYAYVAFHVSYF